MKNNYVRGALLGLLVLAVVAAMPQDKVTLRLNLEAGQTFGYLMKIDQTIRQNMMGQEQEITQQIGMGTRFDVLAAEDDAFDVKVTYTQVSYTQNSPMGEVSYDSQNPPEEVPPAAIGFQALVGRGFTLKLDRQGQVLALDGVDAMLDAMISGFGELDEATTAQVRDGLKQQFGDEAMRSQMESLMAIYPEEPVGEGDSWTKERDVTAGMPMHFSNAYKLVARADGVSQVDIVSTIEPGEGGPVAMGGMELDYQISGLQEGTSWIDEQTGLVQRSTTTQDLAGEVTMNGSMTWPIELQTRTTLEPLGE